MAKSPKILLKKVDINNQEFHIVTSGGSRWFVDPDNLQALASWHLKTELKIVEHRDSMFNYDITNMSNNEIIRARFYMKIDKNNSGLSGEYFVAAELYRRGWSVGMTIGNAKSIDIFAEKNNIKVDVQVKSIFHKESVGWPIKKSQIKKGCIYIFVNLNGDDMESPDYYILNSMETNDIIRQYSTRDIVNLSDVKKINCKSWWGKLEV